MPAAPCDICRAPKGNLGCGLCAAAVCKHCAQSVEKDSFPLLRPVPVELSHRVYCPPCYVREVGPALSAYQRRVARARQVFVFEKGATGAETRLIRRIEKPLAVADCADERDTLMRLAFLAAGGEFNALVDVVVSRKKTRDTHGYQSMTWQGTGVPIRIDAAQFDKVAHYAVLRPLSN